MLYGLVLSSSFLAAYEWMKGKKEVKK